MTHKKTTNSTTEPPQDNTRPLLELIGLTVEFGDKNSTTIVVDGVDFDIKPGESYGLIGESGCGKSTILRAISGINTDYEGAIVLDGKELAQKRSKQHIRAVQMVFQDPFGSLHPRKMIYRVLAESVHLMGLDRQDARITEVLAAVGLADDIRFRFPHELSGGQRQRVAIARALIVEPQLLLLDEPTSALDVSVQAEILNLLARLRRERGLTYLMVSHDLAVVARMCERVAIMRDGTILEEIAPHHLTSGQVTHDYTRDFLTASTPALARA